MAQRAPREDRALSSGIHSSGSQRHWLWPGVVGCPPQRCPRLIFTTVLPTLPNHARCGAWVIAGSQFKCLLHEGYKPRLREVNSLPQGCTASKDWIPTQNCLTSKPRFLTIASLSPFTKNFHTDDFLKPHKSLPKLGFL